MPHNLVAAALLLLSAIPATAVTCSAVSGESRLALLELYTSEGCDSCPPVDRWFSALPQRGYTPQRLLALAFHVDYWNYLGWKDPYAQARFSARQRNAGRRNQARMIYTPQLILDGADYRSGLSGDDIGRRITAINSQPPGARIRMNIDGDDGLQRLHAVVATGSDASAGSAQAYVAVYENNLLNHVMGGENRGKRLRHDFVVRELYGPLAMGVQGTLAFDRIIRRDPQWKTADLHVAVFLQDKETGMTLQALDMPWCVHGADW